MGVKRGRISIPWTSVALLSQRPTGLARLRRVVCPVSMTGMTWSILARDPVTGALGAAVASRFFAVGALAIHVEGGVAALATQALINPMYAVAGMARLRAGDAPDAVAAALLAADAGREHRQLHIVDAQGRIAQHTGRACVAWCGSVRGGGCVGRRQHAGGTGGGGHARLQAFQRATGSLRRTAADGAGSG